MDPKNTQLMKMFFSIKLPEPNFIKTWKYWIFALHFAVTFFIKIATKKKGLLINFFKNKTKKHEKWWEKMTLFRFFRPESNPMWSPPENREAFYFYENYCKKVTTKCTWLFTIFMILSQNSRANCINACINLYPKFRSGT